MPYHRQHLDILFRIINYWQMVFALNPQEIIKMTGLSLPKLMLGSKERNPTLWRVLSNLMTGKTVRPQKKTLKALEASMISSLNQLIGESPPLGFFSAAANLPGARPWELSIAAFHEGRIQADPNFAPSMDLFGTEAIRFDQIACDTIVRFLDQESYQEAVEYIKTQWELSRLPCSQWVIENIDTSGSRDRFIASVLPLTIITTLYLLACWSIEEKENSTYVLPIMPEQRNERLVRPMTSWLEGFKAREHISTIRSLSDHFLYPRSEAEDIETLRRVFRRWWTKGEIPAWSRVPHITRSLLRQFTNVEYKNISASLELELGKIRVVDRLLSLSLEIQEKCLPSYEPLLPFQDYELMLTHAHEAKAALSLRMKQ